MTDISGRVTSLETQVTQINAAMLQRPDLTAFYNYQRGLAQDLQVLSDTYSALKDQIRATNSIYANLVNQVNTNLSYLTGHTGSASLHYTARTQRIVTGSATLLSTDSVVLVGNTAGTIIVTLPALNNASGNFYYFKKTDASGYTCTITGSAAIDGSSVYTMSAQYSSVILYSNGITWNTF